ncbi:hypothetical protein KUTeg_008581, partial [Tegillarca granosa]
MPLTYVHLTQIEFPNLKYVFGKELNCQNWAQFPNIVVNKERCFITTTNSTFATKIITDRGQSKQYTTTTTTTSTKTIFFTSDIHTVSDTTEDNKKEKNTNTTFLPTEVKTMSKIQTETTVLATTSDNLTLTTDKNVVNGTNTVVQSSNTCEFKIFLTLIGTISTLFVGILCLICVIIVKKFSRNRLVYQDVNEMSVINRRRSCIKALATCGNCDKEICTEMCLKCDTVNLPINDVDNLHDIIKYSIYNKKWYIPNYIEITQCIAWKRSGEITLPQDVKEKYVQRSHYLDDMETLQELAGEKLFFHLKNIESELAERLFYIYYGFTDIEEELDNLMSMIENLKFIKEPLQFKLYETQFHTTDHILDLLEDGETNNQIDLATIRQFQKRRLSSVKID